MIPLGECSAVTGLKYKTSGYTYKFELTLFGTLSQFSKVLSIIHSCGDK